MAHYAQPMPSARLPERPQGPDQPWTGWWQPDVPDGGPPAGAPEARGAAPRIPLEAPETLAPDPDGALDRDASDRGGLRRVGVEPSGAPIAAGDDHGHAPDERLPDWSALETAATLAFAPVAGVLAEADFSVEGVARRTGDLVFAGITFPCALDRAPRPASIRLTISDAANVNRDSVAIATLRGFGPDRIGFTLVASALNPGAMWVDGHYHVEQ